MSVLIRSTQSLAVKYLYQCSVKLHSSQFQGICLNRFYCSSGAFTTPAPDDCEKVYPPKIMQIVDQISKLTLIEAADLNECLKKTFNIKDIPMAMGAMSMAAAHAGDVEPEAELTKSSFTVKLLKYEDNKKVSVIKEIKNIIEGLNLVQAKKFVEGVPQIVKGDIGKGEADKLKETLEAAGGVCEIS